MQIVIDVIAIITFVSYIIIGYKFYRFNKTFKRLLGMLQADKIASMSVEKMLYDAIKQNRK